MPELGFGSIAKKIQNSVDNKAKEVTAKAKDQIVETIRNAVSVSNSYYGNDLAIFIEVDGNEINLTDATFSGVMIDSGMSPEAGICQVHMEVPGYNFSDENKISVHKDFAQFKVGRVLKIKISNKFVDEKPVDAVSVFNGFIERIEYRISASGNTEFVLHGMDAKMWMMANKLTKARGEGQNLETIITSAINDYNSLAKKGTISLLKNINIKNTFYQANQSDYEFLCALADSTGSLFYVDADGKVNFCAPSKLGTPNNTISSKEGRVKSVELSASVWGTPQCVKVTAIDPIDPSKPISAQCISANSIGSGKAPKQVVPQNFSSETKGIRYVNIIDDTIDSMEQAKARAEATYNIRNLRFAEVVLTVQGNPGLRVGQGMTLSYFGDPFDNEYLIARVEHLWRTFSDDQMYSTRLYLVANKIHVQEV
ncbi:MAG: hypothetical protein IKE05_01810 [Clostridia bacterium]|nr:hypothetical protein [Clostridia bacterium]